MQDSLSKDPHRDAVTMTANCHRHRSRLHTYAVAICFAVMMSLVGCTSTPTDPSTSASAPETSSPATTTATSTSTAEQPTPPPTTTAVYKPATADGPAQNVPVPILPEKAKEFSKEGLLAFTEYWYSTLGYAFETGDPEPMMAISGPDCLTCQAIEKMVVAGHSDGKWISGGKMVLGTPDTSFVLATQNNYQVTVMARQEQVKYFSAAKTLVEDFGVTIAQGNILIGVHEGGQWVALTVEHLAGSKAS